MKSRQYRNRVNKAIFELFTEGGVSNDFTMPTSCLLKAVPKVKGISYNIVTLLKQDFLTEGETIEFYCEKDDHVQIVDCQLYANVGLDNWILIGEA